MSKRSDEPSDSTSPKNGRGRLERWLTHRRKRQRLLAQQELENEITFQVFNHHESASSPSTSSPHLQFDIASETQISAKSGEEQVAERPCQPKHSPNDLTSAHASTPTPWCLTQSSSPDDGSQNIFVESSSPNQSDEIGHHSRNDSTAETFSAISACLQTPLVERKSNITSNEPLSMTTLSKSADKDNSPRCCFDDTAESKCHDGENSQPALLGHTSSGACTSFLAWCPNDTSRTDHSFSYTQALATQDEDHIGTQTSSKLSPSDPSPHTCNFQNAERMTSVSEAKMVTHGKLEASRLCLSLNDAAADLITQPVPKNGTPCFGKQHTSQVSSSSKQTSTENQSNQPYWTPVPNSRNAIKSPYASEKAKAERWHTADHMSNRQLRETDLKHAINQNTDSNSCCSTFGVVRQQRRFSSSCEKDFSIAWSGHRSSVSNHNTPRASQLFDVQPVSTVRTKSYTKGETSKESGTFQATRDELSKSTGETSSNNQVLVRTTSKPPSKRCVMNATDSITALSIRGCLAPQDDDSKMQSSTSHSQHSETVHNAAMSTAGSAMAEKDPNQHANYGLETVSQNKPNESNQTFIVAFRTAGCGRQLEVSDNDLLRAGKLLAQEPKTKSSCTSVRQRTKCRDVRLAKQQRNSMGATHGYLQSATHTPAFCTAGSGRKLEVSENDLIQAGALLAQEPKQKTVKSSRANSNQLARNRNPQQQQNKPMGGTYGGSETASTIPVFCTAGSGRRLEVSENDLRRAGALLARENKEKAKSRPGYTNTDQPARENREKAKLQPRVSMEVTRAKSTSAPTTASFCTAGTGRQLEVSENDLRARALLAQEPKEKTVSMSTYTNSGRQARGRMAQAMQQQQKPIATARGTLITNTITATLCTVGSGSQLEASEDDLRRVSPLLVQESKEKTEPMPTCANAGQEARVPKRKPFATTRATLKINPTTVAFCTAGSGRQLEVSEDDLRRAGDLLAQQPKVKTESLPTHTNAGQQIRGKHARTMQQQQKPFATTRATLKTNPVAAFCTAGSGRQLEVSENDLRRAGDLLAQQPKVKTESLPTHTNAGQQIRGKHAQTMQQQRKPFATTRATLKINPTTSAFCTAGSGRQLEVSEDDLRQASALLSHEPKENTESIPTYANGGNQRRDRKAYSMQHQRQQIVATRGTWKGNPTAAAFCTAGTGRQLEVSENDLRRAGDLLSQDPNASSESMPRCTNVRQVARDNKPQAIQQQRLSKGVTRGKFASAPTAASFCTAGSGRELEVSENDLQWAGCLLAQEPKEETESMATHSNEGQQARDRKTQARQQIKRATTMVTVCKVRNGSSFNASDLRRVGDVFAKESVLTDSKTADACLWQLEKREDSHSINQQSRSMNASHAGQESTSAIAAFCAAGGGRQLEASENDLLQAGPLLGQEPKQTKATAHSTSASQLAKNRKPQARPQESKPSYTVDMGLKKAPSTVAFCAVGSGRQLDMSENDLHGASALLVKETQSKTESDYCGPSAVPLDMGKSVAWKRSNTLPSVSASLNTTIEGRLKISASTLRPAGVVLQPEPNDVTKSLSSGTNVDVLDTSRSVQTTSAETNSSAELHGTKTTPIASSSCTARSGGELEVSKNDVNCAGSLLEKGTKEEAKSMSMSADADLSKMSIDLQQGNYPTEERLRGTKIASVAAAFCTAGSGRQLEVSENDLNRAGSLFAEETTEESKSMLMSSNADPLSTRSMNAQRPTHSSTGFTEVQGTRITSVESSFYPAGSGRQPKVSNHESVSKVDSTPDSPRNLDALLSNKTIQKSSKDRRIDDCANIEPLAFSSCGRRLDGSESDPHKNGIDDDAPNSQRFNSSLRLSACPNTFNASCSLTSSGTNLSGSRSHYPEKQVEEDDSPRLSRNCTLDEFESQKGGGSVVLADKSRRHLQSIDVSIDNDNKSDLAFAKSGSERSMAEGEESMEAESSLYKGFSSLGTTLRTSLEDAFDDYVRTVPARVSLLAEELDVKPKSRMSLFDSAISDREPPHTPFHDRAIPYRDAEVDQDQQCQTESRSTCLGQNKNSMCPQLSSSRSTSGSRSQCMCITEIEDRLRTNLETKLLSVSDTPGHSSIKLGHVADSRLKRSLTESDSESARHRKLQRLDVERGTKMSRESATTRVLHNEALSQHVPSVVKHLRPTTHETVFEDLDRDSLKYPSENQSTTPFIAPNLFTSSTLSTLDVCKRVGISTAVLQVSSSNATALRFFSSSGIPCGFQSQLSCQTKGSKWDFEQSLKHLGCDITRVSTKWITNHCKWIIWKLASIERRCCDAVPSPYLHYDRVVSELRKRYKKEIEMGKRSPLRQILNRDVSSREMIVLFISRIFYRNEFGNTPVSEERDRQSRFIFELSDGWYSVIAMPDHFLCTMVNKRLHVGTKVVLCHANLVGAEQGIDPLDKDYNPSPAEASVYLKVVANGTRIASWKSKLGFVRRNSSPLADAKVFRISSISSIVEGGGPIPMIEVFICREFPMLYLEKSEVAEDASPTRRILTEKQEAERLATLERSHSDFVERYVDEIEKEVTEEVDEESPIPWLRKGPIDLLIGDENLSDDQKTELRHWLERRPSIISERIRREIEKMWRQETLSKSESTPFKRFLVSTESPDHRGGHQQALLSIWSPSEEQLNVLRTGAKVRFENLSLRDTRFEDLLQLSGNNRTAISVVQPSRGEKERSDRLFGVAGIYALLRKPKQSHSSLSMEVNLACFLLTVPTGDVDDGVIVSDRSGLVALIQFAKGAPDNLSECWGCVDKPKVVVFRNLLLKHALDKVSGCIVLSYTDYSVVDWKESGPQVSRLRSWLKTREGFHRYSYITAKTAVLSGRKLDSVAMGCLVDFAVLPCKQLLVKVDCGGDLLQVWKFPLWLIQKATSILENSGPCVLNEEREGYLSELSNLDCLLRHRTIFRFTLEKLPTTIPNHSNCVCGVIDIERADVQALSSMFYARLS